METTIKESKMTWAGLLYLIQKKIEEGYLDPEEEVIIFDESREDNRCSKVILSQTSLYLEDKDFQQLNHVELIGRTNNKEKYFEIIK